MPIGAEETYDFSHRRREGHPGNHLRRGDVGRSGQETRRYRRVRWRGRMLAFMTASTVKNERRKINRKRPAGLVYVELSSGNGGMMRDLSDDGFSVRVVMPLQAGEKTPFSFSLNEIERIEGEGKILWVEEGGRVAGIRFTQISAVDRKVIQDWLKRPADLPARKDATARRPAPPTKTLEQLRKEIHSLAAREEKPEAEAATVKEEIDEPAAPAQTSVLPPRETAAVSPAVPADALEQIREELRSWTAGQEKPAGAGGAGEESVAGPAAGAAQAPTSPPSAQSATDAAQIADTLESPSRTAFERPSDAAPLTPLPPLILPRVDATVKLPPVAKPAEQERIQGTDSGMAVALPEYLGEENGQPTAEGLPEISTILIQPHGKLNEGGAERWGPGGLPASEQAATTVWEPRPGRFTLTAAIALMCILAAAVGGYVYHREVGRGLIWLGEQMGGGEEKSPQGQENGINAYSPAPGETASEPQTENGGAESAPAIATHSSAAISSAQKNSPAAVTPLSGLSANLTSAGQETGEKEYLQAMSLLRGKNSNLNMDEAVRLLWAAVEKGNPGAEIALADMYWQGRGVAKNCDQTRILLTAAARNGNAEGQKRLRQFQQEGCE